MSQWRETNKSQFDPSGLVASTAGLWRTLEPTTPVLWLYLFSPLNCWVISTTVGPQLYLDGLLASEFWGAVNNQRWWQRSTTRVLWFNGRRWAISWGPGTGIREWTDYLGNTLGDTWWQRDISGGGWLAEGLYEPHGTAGSTKIKTTMALQGWRKVAGTSAPNSADPAGEYEWFSRTAVVADDGTVTETIATAPPGGTPAKRIIGLGLWKDQDGGEYQRSLETDSASAPWPPYYHSYGALRRRQVSGAWKWIVGTAGSAAGWWQGDNEPSLDAPTVYARQKIVDGDYPGPADLTLTYHSAAMGTDKTQGMVAEVGLWL